MLFRSDTPSGVGTCAARMLGVSLWKKTAAYSLAVLHTKVAITHLLTRYIMAFCRAFIVWFTQNVFQCLTAAHTSKKNTFISRTSLFVSIFYRLYMLVNWTKSSWKNTGNERFSLRNVRWTSNFHGSWSEEKVKFITNLAMKKKEKK